MDLFMTGATGFIGSRLVRALLRHGHTVRALVRPASRYKLPRHARLKAVRGDLRRPGPWQREAARCGVILHLAGIVRQQVPDLTYEHVHVDGTARVVEAAASASRPPRIVFLSSLGSAPHAASAYHRSKWRAEEIVRESGLRYIILRPSAVVGRGNPFLDLLARLIRWSPVVPVVGDGQALLQPICIDDVVEGLAKAPSLSLGSRAAYDVGGPRPYTVVELVKALGRVIGRTRVPLLHVPVEVARPVARLGCRLRLVPLTPSILAMMLEGSACNPLDYYKDFYVRPTPFERAAAVFAGRRSRAG